MDRETELLREWLFKSDDENISELREQALIVVQMVHGEEITNQIKDETEKARAKEEMERFKIRHEAEWEKKQQIRLLKSIKDWEGSIVDEARQSKLSNKLKKLLTLL